MMTPSASNGRGAFAVYRTAAASAVAVLAAVALLTQSRPAAAGMQYGSPAVSLQVSRTAETAVAFTTLPSASCLIGAGATAPMPLTADVAGTVRFFARTGLAAPPSIRLTAVCSKGTAQWRIPLDVGSVAGGVRNAIPRPVADPAFHLPVGFDPASASDAEVARLGFPHRPDRFAHPDLFFAWVRAKQTAVRVESGAIALPDTYSQRPPEQGSPGGKPRRTNNWSGILANGAFGQYADVEGSWYVPSVSAPSQDAPASSVMWVGIDGADKAKGLYQDGTGQNVYYASGVMMTDYYAWYEIVPGYPIQRFQNFVVNPGDLVEAQALSCSSGGSTFYACFFVYDLTQGTVISSSLSTNKPVNDGAAEWIMERPTIKKSLPPMPDYGKFAASSMDVYDTFLGNWTKYANESHEPVYMYNGQDLLSQAGGGSSGDDAEYTWDNYL